MAADVPKTKDSRFFISTARSGTGLSFPHREAASGKDKMLFPISDVEYQPAFHASLSNDR